LPMMRYSLINALETFVAAMHTFSLLPACQE
jgi:hypothetical protein